MEAAVGAEEWPSGTQVWKWKQGAKNAEARKVRERKCAAIPVVSVTRKAEEVEGMGTITGIRC
jgi:hypothetical protein